MIGAQPLIFGIVNVTPDSFSDGGDFLDAEAAVAQGLRLVAAGADLVDVGGESTRPGAVPVPPEEEQRRVLPVVRRLVDAGVAVSLDTRHAGTAAAGITAGVQVVNDVSAGTHDPAMLGVVAGAEVDYVLMHSRGPSGRAGRYRDVVGEVAAELQQHRAAALAAGVPAARLVLDPGIGFSKNEGENWAVLSNLQRIVPAGQRLLVGASRKRFLNALLDGGAPLDGADRADARDLPTSVLSALLARAGVWGLRVHDVGSTRVALRVVAALSEEGR